MPLNVQLRDLLRDVRAETGRALTVSMNQAETEHLKVVLRRVQDSIAAEYDWPHLMVDKDLTFSAGERYRSYPAGLGFEGVRSAHSQMGPQWVPLQYGITPDHLNAYNSNAGVVGFPIARWQHKADDGTFEVWPVPSQSVVVRLRGKRDLRPLIDDDDLCDIDSNAIVLVAAAQLLAREKAEDATVKMGDAQSYMRRLMAAQVGAKRKVMVIGGGWDGLSRVRRPRAGIDYIP